MFYSHTFLSSKGPLATVWIAAHLQHKLRKSQVAVTDISTSVDYIMFPEVPMALRLSGYLLLGVVRIYSKKVNYLYHDCNEVLTRMRTAFASIQVSLPEDANRAPFHSITLPERFELDALDIDDSTYYAEAPDNHLGTHDNITITERISSEGNSHVAFSVDEDAQMDTFQNETTQLHDEPMDENFLNLFPGSKDAGVMDPTPSNQAEECSHKHNEDHLSLELPEVEILRDFVQPQLLEKENLPVWHVLDNDISGHREPFCPVIDLKENNSPTTNELSVCAVGSLPSQLHSIPVTAGSLQDLGVSDLQVLSVSHDTGPAFSEIEIQPNSSKEKEKMKSRTGGQFFDESIVLTNELIKEQLNDTTKLLRKRKNLPLTALDVWKSQKRLRKEQLFDEPMMTRASDDIHEFLKKGFYRVNSNVMEALLESRDAESLSGTPTFEMEIEHPRFKERHVDGALTEFMPLPAGEDEFTPHYSGNSGSVPQTGKSLETEVLLTPELKPSEHDGTNRETSIGLYDQPLHAGDTVIPDLLHPAEAEVLNFLELDNTQDGHGDEVYTLPVRTRAAVQYLRMQSHSDSLCQSGESRHLSLSRILAGKTRKQCARMLFETLVLATRRFINVQQEDAYGDILLSLTTEFSEEKF